MKIGEKTLKELASLAESALLTHINPLNVAFRNAGEKDFKIGLKGTINAGAGEGDFKLKIDIDYVIEKASDSFSRQVHEKQTNLFDKNEPTKVWPMRDDGAEIFISVCAGCKDRQSVIVCDGLNMPVEYGRFDKIPESIIEAIVQYRACRAWADEDYKTWCDEMVLRANVMLAERAASLEKNEDKPKFKKIAGGKK
jgi:hypothetical protein